MADHLRHVVLAIASAAFANEIEDRTLVAFLRDATPTFAVTVAALLRVVLYSSGFVWLELVTTLAIGNGLLYNVVWEGSPWVRGQCVF